MKTEIDVPNIAEVFIKDCLQVDDSSVLSKDDGVISCNVCKITFTLKASLVRHMRKQHNITVKQIPRKPNEIREKLGIDDKATNCPICELHFVNHHSLLRHLRNFHVKKSVKDDNE